MKTQFNPICNNNLKQVNSNRYTFVEFQLYKWQEKPHSDLNFFKIQFYSFVQYYQVR